jgi:cobalt-zinc-cadmium resistance protein CzcA
MMGRWIDACVTHRALVLALTLVAVVLGLVSLQRMTFDAFPDLTNVQVQVLTSSPGLGSEEVERLVTMPVERALGGVADVRQLRSVSRPGVSSVTVIFADGVDPWRARQMVAERVAGAAVPEGVASPELAPMTTGLGEIYQFTLASDDLPPYELTRLFERDVAPRLRAVDGVVEVNVWGGGAPQVDVWLDPYRLRAHGLSVRGVASAVDSALGTTSGGVLAQGEARALVRAVANPADAASLGDVAVGERGGRTTRLSDVADLRQAGGDTVGLGTADGEGEVLFVMVQLLAGADARRVGADVRERVEQVRASLPRGVRLETIYDRGKLVDNTLGTVERSLVEGGLLVVFVLLLLLGDLRAGLVVASVIPLSMLGAFVGLAALGYSGNLMSLGAIDFGLVVDGTIVVVESIVALDLSARGAWRSAVAARTQAVARPVLFAVGILVLVYLPVLGMVGTEGKLFRPMAVTVLLALLTALVLSFTYVPALASFVVRPSGEHSTALMRLLSRGYQPLLERALASPWRVGALALAGVALSALLGARLGVEFVPRLEEGDMVVQTARSPSTGAARALREVTRIEALLGSFPEVERVASRTGAPALATDPMGLEEADILVRLAPRGSWTTAEDLAGLTAAMSARLSAEVPDAELTFTQPIEMRFNELLEGITADVGVAIYGPDQAELLRLGQEVAAALATVRGAVDVVAPTMEGMPSVDVRIDVANAAALGVDPGEVRAVVGALQRGVPAGAVRRGAVSEAVVLKIARPPEVALVDLPVGRVTLGDVATVVEGSQPAVIRRQEGSRRVVVQANVRDRDVGGMVVDAKAAVAAQVPLPEGYWMTWAGKAEQLRTAAIRTAITVPVVLGAIAVVLYYALGGWSPAALIFVNVPVAASGGVVALWARGMPLSMSAVVGFIALFGIAVMNGIVWMTRARELHEGATALAAARQAALERFRPVLMTASVAGIGFLPMALASGVGAEVQRPLATVVIGGLLTCTPLTLLVLPAWYGSWFARQGASR